MPRHSIEIEIEIEIEIYAFVHARTCPHPRRIPAWHHREESTFQNARTPNRGHKYVDTIISLFSVGNKLILNYEQDAWRCDVMWLPNHDVARSLDTFKIVDFAW